VSLDPGIHASLETAGARRKRHHNRHEQPESRPIFWLEALYRAPHHRSAVHPHNQIHLLQGTHSSADSTIDDELPLFGRHTDDFRAMGIQVAVSSERTGLLCNDKYATAQFLLDRSIPFARTWLPAELDIPRLQYPLFLKPRSGRGSVGAFTINTERELRFFLEYVPNPIVQEFLSGREFTIDLLADFHGKVISVVPRERMVVRSGVTDRGKTVQHSGMIQLAIRTAEALDIRGQPIFRLSWRMRSQRSLK